MGRKGLCRGLRKGVSQGVVKGVVQGVVQGVVWGILRLRFDSALLHCSCHSLLAQLSLGFFLLGRNQFLHDDFRSGLVLVQTPVDVLLLDLTVVLVDAPL